MILFKPVLIIITHLQVLVANMKLLTVLFGIFAVAHGFGAWKGGLSVKYGPLTLGTGSSHFINVPRSISEAKNARWVETPRPPGPMPILHLLCPSQNDRTLCALYDDTSFVAGLQIALPIDAFADAYLDWDVQGFTRWDPPAQANGVIRSYWTLTQYFINEDTLKRPVGDRINSRNPDKTLQEDYVWVTGFHKERMAISVVGDKIAQTQNTHFTKQGCLENMGLHYYWNMTEQSLCTSDQMFPWFPLVDNNELVAMGFVIVGKLPEKSIPRDYFERPNKLAVEVIVPHGPKCLYDIADSPQLLTMHTYFVDKPYLISCVL